MNKYKIVITEEAQCDLRNLSNLISYKYKAPMTAIRYLKSIYTEMHLLSQSAESFPIQNIESLQKYGPYPRRLNYKKTAIIFNVVNNDVYIRRVIPANTIFES